jgi:predicted Rossmann fold flavoprotein
MERFDALVIGGGPAGLMAAGRAAEAGERVLLVEKNDSLGEKLLLAGRRRCNMTNAEPDLEKFLSRYGVNGRFLHGAFSRFSPADTIKFFESQGIKTRTERGSRVFPDDAGAGGGAGEKGGAQRVLDALLLYCKKGTVRFLRRSPVRAVKVRSGRVERVVTGVEELMAGRYILATGGKSYPKTGSHEIRSPRPRPAHECSAAHLPFPHTPAIICARVPLRGHILTGA